MGQLSSLFYKNWLLYKRGIIGNILEFLVPIFFIIFVMVTKNLDPPVTYAQQSFISNTTYARTITSVNNASAYLKYIFHQIQTLFWTNGRFSSIRRPSRQQTKHHDQRLWIHHSDFCDSGRLRCLYQKYKLRVPDKSVFRHRRD
jgi:hypothetical protein